MGTYRIPPVSNLLMWSQQKITVTFLRYCVQNILDWTRTSNQIKWRGVAIPMNFGLVGAAQGPKPWPFLRMRETKIYTLIESQTRKMTSCSREKQTRRINGDKQTLVKSLCWYFNGRFSFNRWWVSRVVGHLRTRILADTISVPYLRITPGTQSPQEQKWSPT